MWLFGDHGRLIKRYNPNSLKLDFSVLSSDVTVYDDTTEQQLSERIQGADIIVIKEMPVNANMIQSISRICQTYL